MTAADHETRITRLDAEVAELRPRRIDPRRDAEFVAAEVLELVGPGGAQRIAAALLVAADDVREVSA